MIERGKRSKTLSEVKQVENISKNLQSFLEIRPVQKEVLISHDCETMHMNTRILSDKRKITSQRNCQNQLCHPGLSHREQEECVESLIQEKIHNQLNSKEGLEYS